MIISRVGQQFASAAARSVQARNDCPDRNIRDFGDLPVVLITTQ